MRKPRIPPAPKEYSIHSSTHWYSGYCCFISGEMPTTVAPLPAAWIAGWDSAWLAVFCEVEAAGALSELRILREYRDRMRVTMGLFYA